MCETCVLQVFDTCITYVIHLKHQTYIACVSHMKYTWVTFDSVYSSIHIIYITNTKGGELESDYIAFNINEKR